MEISTILLNPAGAWVGGALAISKGTHLLCAPSRKFNPFKSMKVNLACTGSSGTSRIVSGLRETNGCELALFTDAVGHVGFGKGQSFGGSSEPAGSPNKPLPTALVWDPLNMNGKKLARASHVSDLNASGVQNTVIGTVNYGDLTEHTKEAIYGSTWDTWNLSQCGDSLRDPDKKAMDTVFFKAEYGPHILRLFAGMPASAEGNSFRSASLISDLSSIGVCYTIGQLSMILNQLPGGAVQATTCMLKPVQFKVPYVGVTFGPFRRSASGGTPGFCDFGYAESAYGGMLVEPESALLAHKERAIQFHAGMLFDQFRKSTPPSVTFLAAGSRELLTIQFKGTVDLMYVGGWFDLILMALSGLVKSICQGRHLAWGSGRAHCDLR